MKKIMLMTILLVLFSASGVLAQAPGDTLWTKTYGGVDIDSGTSVQQTTDGGYIVTGNTENFGAGGKDVWLIKTNTSGDTLWTKTYGGTNDNYGQSVQQTTDGGYIVTGWTKSSSFCYLGYLIKTDSDGNTLWTKTFGDDGFFKYTEFYSGQQTSDGGYVIAGYTTCYGAGGYDVYLIKTDSNGDTLWTNTYGGSGADQGWSVQQTTDGGYIVAGFTESYAIGNLDVYLVKTDSNGDTLWTKTYGGAGYEKGFSARQTSDGGYIVGGYTGTADMYSRDMYLIKTDSNGDTLWTKIYGGATGDEESRLVIQTSDGGYIATGSTASYGAGSHDVYLLKTDSYGDTLWTGTYGGTGFDYGYSVQQITGGGYIVAGYTTSYGAGYYDVWLLKIAGEQIIGDFNSDGYVDATDLQMFGDHWHFVNTDPGWDALYDLVPDNIIDAADLQVFGDHWHEGTPPRSGEGGKDGKGPNEFAGIVFDLDALTPGNQNLTSIPSQPAGTNIRLDVYCTDVVNLDTYEFEVIYDETELSYISSSATNPITFEPNILTTNGGTALGWMVDNSTPGVLSIAYTLAGNDPAQAPEGEGLIADIVFQAQVNTYGTLSFGDVYYYDSYGVVDLITDTGTATLPVELSSFTANYNTVSGFVSLCWATASETDVNGFNIYRNTENSFVEAEKINIDLIAGSGTTTETTEYSFTDETADPYYTTYYYWLEVINFSGTNDKFGPYKYIPIDVNQDGELGIITSALSPCYPNPSRIGNEIKFNFRVGGLEGTTRNVELKVYNILGKLVANVVDGELLVNDYTETWKPENLSNGVYFYQLKTDNYSEVKKMMIQ